MQKINIALLVLVALTGGGLAIRTGWRMADLARPDFERDRAAPGSAERLGIGIERASSAKASSGQIFGASDSVKPRAGRLFRSQRIAGSDGSAESYRVDAIEFLPLADGAPKAVAVGDVNGDLRPDLVVATGEWFNNPQGNSVFIYLQTTTGMLEDPIQLRYSDATTQWAGVAIGDLDKDGIGDIVVGHDHGIAIVRGAHTGFVTKNYPLDMAATNVALIDLDLDGGLDIVGLSPSDGATLVYVDGRATPRRIATVDVPVYGWNDMKVGEVTGDGLLDLVITSNYTPDLVILPHAISDGFDSPIVQSLSTEYWNPEGGAVGDFNGDGLDDVAMTVSQNAPAYIRIFNQHVDGRLSSEPALLSSYDIPGPLIAADLDNDGRQDLVTMHDGWGALGYYLQRDGHMLEEVKVQLPFASSYRPNGLASGDLDGDDCIDVAAAGAQRGVLIFHGKGCATRPHHMSDPLMPRPRPSDESDSAVKQASYPPRAQLTTARPAF